MATIHSNTTTAALCGDAAPVVRPAGKGQIAGVSKNMPALLGVMGQVDRLYRPQLASRLFGEPFMSTAEDVAERRKQLIDNSAEARDSRVPAKPHSRPWAACLAEGAVTCSTPVRGELVYVASTKALKRDVDRMALENRMRALEAKLEHCDTSIQRIEDEALTVVAQREMHIAKKKNRMTRLKRTVTLSRQAASANALAPADGNNSSGGSQTPDFLTNASAAHHLAVVHANHNPLTMGRAVPVVLSRQCDAIRSICTAPACLPVPREAACERPQELVKTIRISESWQSAVKKHQMKLVEECTIPRERCATELRIHRGPRYFPSLHSHVAPFATIVPSSSESATIDVPSDDRSGHPRRQMRNVTLSRPVDWLRREVQRSSERYNEGIVISPEASSPSAAAAVFAEKRRIMCGGSVPKPKPLPQPADQQQSVEVGDDACIKSSPAQEA